MYVILNQIWQVIHPPSSQGYGFSSGHVWCESWTVKKAECRRIDAFELWCWRRLLRVPWTARRSNQSIIKEISYGCSLEGLMLKQNSNSWASSCEELTYWKRPWCWEGLGAGGEGMTEDEMAGWHHWLDGRESEWTPGVGDGQGGLVCCDSWAAKESDTTEQLNWTEEVKRKICYSEELIPAITLSQGRHPGSSNWTEIWRYGGN